MHRPGLAIFLLTVVLRAFAQPDPGTRELPDAVLRDRIHGAILGEIFGNLNGLRHEMKYIAEPGNVQTYTPALSQGARTDDDTDIEWIYHIYMEKEGQILLPPEVIVRLWRNHLNRGIWCSNHYVRNLMDLGLEPPTTGRIAINPWAYFNLWGQFGCESFGLMAPGLPETASKIGLHYTQVSIDGEPAQVTQFLDTMFALAYWESDLNKLLDEGLKGIDPRSEVNAIVADVRRWHGENPTDWRATRQLIRDKYTRFKGDMPDKNGAVLNIAAIVGALLYGNGDYAETMRLCFNFGWDADCTAATAGTLIGQIKGKRWFDAQGWPIKDIYANTTRERMPTDETITGYADRVYRLAMRVLGDHRAKLEKRATGDVWVIRAQRPVVVSKLPDPLDREDELRREWAGKIDEDLASPDGQSRARAAYLAIVLNQAPRLQKERPAEFAAAVRALQEGYPTVVKNIFDAPLPRGPALRERATASGLHGPSK
jgi:hypothetical protein